MNLNKTNLQIAIAIDGLSESARISGVESPITEFLINYLTANIDDLVEAWESREDEGA